MFTLATGETLRGVAGSASAITYTVTGDEKGTTDAFKVLAQGQLSAVSGTLYTVPASNRALVQTIFLQNTTAGAVTVGFFINGTAGANQIVAFTMEANGSAILAADGWKNYDSTGKQLFVGSTGAQGIQGIQGEKGWSPVLAVVTDGARRVFQIVNWVGGAGTMPSVTNQFIGSVGIVATAALAVDVRGAAGADAAAFTTITGNSGSATADGVDTLSLVGSGAVTTVASDNPEVITISLVPDGVTNAMLNNMNANTIKTNATAGSDNPTDVAIAANQFLARDSSSNLVPKSVTDAAFTFLSAANAAAETALLDAATSTLKGLILAAEKNRISTTDLWFDVVADGGIDRTGVVDGTVALQAAITTVGTAGGGTVYIPQNCSIKTSANINILFPNVTIKGGSRVTSRIVPTHATGNVFTANAANGFIRFENMRIQPTSFTLRTAGYGIEVVSGTANCSIQWVDVLGMWSAIKASGQLCRMEDLGLRECGYGAINGCMILFDSFTDQYVKAVVCDNGTVAPNAPMAGFSGIRITSLSSLLMTDCQWIHCGAGIDVVPAGTNTIPSIYCLNNFFDQGTIGGNFVSGSGNILRSRFIGCWFSGNSTAGVVLNGASLNGLDFIGCEFYGAPSAQPVGIDAINAQEWSVRASRFAGNTIAIRTTAGANHSFSITDNIIGNVSGVGANGQGVTVQAGTYKRYQILDNRGFESNTTPGLSDLGVVGPTDQKNVGNNMGALLKGQLQLTTAGAAAVTNGRGIVSVGAAAQVLFGARIPANAVSVGQTFRVTAWVQSQGAGTLIWRVLAGPAGTAADPVPFITAVSGAQVANAWSRVEAIVTVAALGAAGNVVAVGQVVNNAVVVNPPAAVEVAAVTAPTTAPWFISLGCTVSTSTVTVRHAVIEAL